jgi:hypothetical protein
MGIDQSTVAKSVSLRQARMRESSLLVDSSNLAESMVIWPFHEPLATLNSSTTTPWSLNNKLSLLIPISKIATLREMKNFSSLHAMVFGTVSAINKSSTLSEEASTMEKNWHRSARKPWIDVLRLIQKLAVSVAIMWVA